MRILHVITGLGVGGAEKALARIVKGQKDRGQEVAVVSLLPPLPVADDIEKAGVRVTDLGMTPGRPSPGAILHLARLLRREGPGVLQTWMYHANVAGSIARTLSGLRTAVVWNIQSSDLDLSFYSKTTSFAVRLGAALSRGPRAVVVNSEAGRRHHEGIGYHPRRWELIPNGIDVSSFRPDEAARADSRRELGIGPGTPVVGLLARHDPMKDHETFFRAAGEVVRQTPDAVFVLAGEGTNEANRELAEMAWRNGVADRTKLLGVRHDVPRLLNAFDVLLLTSRFGEGFPSVVAEAMACGVPCVVTECGDAPEIVGDTGRVVPRRDAESLAEACRNLLSLDPEARRSLGARARERVCGLFSLDACLDSYQALYDDLRKVS